MALHRRFHDALFEAVELCDPDMPPGRDRLAAGARAYLDGCLQHRGVKALLLEARGLLPLQEEVLRRNGMTVDLVAADFEALGWPRSQGGGPTVDRGDRGVRPGRTRAERTPDAVAREVLISFTNPLLKAAVAR